MSYEPEDPVWQRLSKALFGVRKTTDEGLFTYRVMERIRTDRAVAAATGAPLQDLAWPRFLRWAVPALGVGVASLVLATRTPVLLMNEDPITSVSEDYP